MKPLLLAALALVAPPAAAAPIVYDFAATFEDRRAFAFDFDGNDLDVPEGLFAGTLADRAARLPSVGGTLTFDDALTQGDADNAFYPAPRLTVAELDLSDLDVIPDFLNVYNDAPFGVGDGITGGIGFPDLDGFVDSFNVYFESNDGTALSSAVPFPELVLSDWDSVNLWFDTDIELENGFAGLRADFRITALTRREEPAPIPLPATGALLAGALGLLALRRR